MFRAIIFLLSGVAHERPLRNWSETKCMYIESTQVCLAYPWMSIQAWYVVSKIGLYFILINIDKWQIDWHQIEIYI